TDLFLPICSLLFPMQRSQPSLHSSEHKIGEERQQRRRNGSRENHLVVHHGQSTKNEFSQSARANRGRNRRQPNGDHGSDSHPGNNYTRSERQLNLEQQLTIGQSHGASSLNHRGIDAANARIGIANQRQQSIERQRQDR